MLLISYNIQYGYGADGIYDLGRVAEVLADADIIALQEVERGWSRTRGDDQPLLLEHFLPGYFAVYGPTMDLDASRREGDRVVNRRRQFGQMILSRWPILWSRTHLLPMRRMADPLNTQTGALEVCIDAPSGPLRVLSVHLAHVGVEERLEQIAALKAILARADLAGPPWSGTDDEPARNWTEGGKEPPNPASLIVMGDFNCEPGAEEMTALLGRNPYHPGAAYHGALVDAVAATGTHLSTHVKLIEGETRWRQLDHILISADLRPCLRTAFTDYEVTASDHYPLWLRLQMPGEAAPPPPGKAKRRKTRKILLSPAP